MRERLQFLCGVGSLLVWLLTFMFTIGSERAGQLSIAWTMRQTGYSGYGYWSASDYSPANFFSKGLVAAGCENPAPLCGCLQNVSKCTNSRQMALQCFQYTRVPQSISESAASTRPYMWLIAMNTWAALVGSVLMVKSKLLDKGSYAVQLTLQIIVLLITLGSMWVMFSAPVAEWVTVLCVSLVIIIVGWTSAEDDEWWVVHLALLYCAVLPALCVIYNTYNQRRDVIYMVTTCCLSLEVALVAGARSFLERAKVSDSDEAVFFCNNTLQLLSICLVCFSYDSDTVNMLQSAIPIFWIYAFYLSLAFPKSADAGVVYIFELVLRAVLTMCMLDELW